MTEVSDVFNQPGAAFVLLPAGVKFPPTEKAWQERPHTFTEAKVHSGNVGILAGNGYIGLDKDDPAAFEGLELPISTVWETRPGRFGLWFRCSNGMAEALAAIGKKPDQAQLKLFKDGKSCGEIKLQRTYQVIPPSHKFIDQVTGDDVPPGKGDRVDYKILDSSPPAEISMAMLLADLRALGITFSSKLEANAAKLERIGKEARQKRAETDEQRTRRYAEAALRDEVLTLAGTSEGDRNAQLNKSAFALGQFVAARVLDESEVIEELTRAARATGLDPNETEKTIRSGLESGTRHPREIPESNDTGPKAEEKASDLLEQIKADPRALKEPANLAALVTLKANDPIEYDLLLEAIKKAGTGIKVATINTLIDKSILESEETADKHGESLEATREKAQAIAERGDPLKYLVWQAQRNHIGDMDYQKVLIASIVSAASLTSNGIQPGGNGEKGSGKSDACAATYHLVPMDRRLDGSLSPMSLFYLQETGRLKPGMILFSDDVEYEPIIPIYKRATARFQHGITHFTVTGGKNREAIELKIPPRMVWWLTSVESVANEQAFDRQYPISTDSSPGHKKRVTAEIAARRARKELRLAEDEGIEVAREIISDIFDNGPFKVLIPQAEKAEWLKVSDFRGQEQFWDLVDALVILRWRQRRKDAGGWLIAEDKDLIEAKAIHTGHKVAHFSDLTEAEVKVIGAMTDGLPKTQRGLTEALEIAQSTLSERLRSIMAKSAIITEDIDQGKKIYSINPNMNLGTSFWDGLDLINLKIDIIETYRSQQITLSACYRYVIGIPIGIIINNSSRIPSSLSVNMEGSIEKGYPCDDCGKCPLREVYLSILSPAKKTDNDKKQQQKPLSDTDKSPYDKTDETDNASSGRSDIPIRQACDIEEQANAQEQHFKNVAGKHTSANPEEPAKDSTERIKIAAVMEYGINGMVDPAIVAGKLHLSVDEVTSWLEANYTRLETPSGVVRYMQHRAGEATT